MSNATYNVVEPVASDWLETRDPAQDLLPINPCCLFTHEDAYNKSIPSRTPSLQCKCAYCGKIFLIDKHTAQDIIVKKRRHIYCSRACSNKSKVKRHKPYQCEMCGKTVQADEYYGEGRFCSPSCSRKYSSKFANSEESIKKKKETLRKYYDSKLGPDRKRQRKHRKSERKKIKLLQKNISKPKFKYETIFNAIIQSKNTFIIKELKSLDLISKNDVIYTIITKMQNKWSLYDIKNILNLKSSIFYEYIRDFKIVENEKFISKYRVKVVEICRRVLNKTIEQGSITIDDVQQIRHHCDFLIHTKNWSNHKVCLEYLGEKKAYVYTLQSLGVASLNIPETLHRRLKFKTSNTIPKQYKLACKFRFSSEIYNYLPGYDLVEQHGWMNRCNNPSGVTRDHMVSVSYGYRHNIDPYLISHPANCMIMSRSKNSSKNKKCSITINELIERVEWFNETILKQTENEIFKQRYKNNLKLTKIYNHNKINHLMTLSYV